MTKHSSPINKTLAEDISKTIKSQCADAYANYDNGDFKKALRQFYQAWLLLPKPQVNYAEAGWVLTGIGDTYFRLQQYQPACEALRSAQHCDSVKDNPFVELRLGQCLCEMEGLPSGRHHLHRAWRLGGQKLFDTEDPRYLDAIKDLLS